MTSETPLPHSFNDSDSKQVACKINKDTHQSHICAVSKYTVLV